MNSIKTIVNDPNVYIESAGRQDRGTIREALADNGADTTLRVTFGLNGESMPMRSLGYYASAILLHERYFPEANVQFIFPSHTAQAINGTDQTQSEKVAEKTQQAAHRFFSTSLRMDSGVAGYYSQFYDLVLPDADLRESVAEVFEKDESLKTAFEGTGKRKGIDYVGYVAAHILLHDTNPLLTKYPFTPLGGAATEYPANGRVISIGAQSERPFYVARMAAREAGVLPEDQTVDTGQLFTRHVLAPYFSCREGEPALPTPPENTPIALEFKKAIEIGSDVPSVQRDLDYLSEVYEIFDSREGARFFTTWNT